ncbi:MAG: 30S ribosome-binding factor RbfA [Lachnospiraceae bacterium]|nr:30S ribosome-binding factor RbfA [Lachnospiraceae bacterium]
MRKNSIKNLRINGEVLRVIAEAVRSSKDPRISKLASVTDVSVAPDLKTCKVKVSVLGSEEEKQRTFEGLQSANGYIRSVVADRLNMRRTPELVFLEDDNTAYAIHMSAKIDEVMARDEEARKARKETDGNVAGG